MAKRNEVDEDGYERTYWDGVGDVLLADHLSPASRNLRRNFLIASSVGIVASVTGIIPKSLLGVDLSGASQSALVWFLILAICYTGLGFAVYTWPERMRLHGALAKLNYRPQNIGDVCVAHVPSGLRDFFDYTFPVLLATLSILLLVWVLIPQAGNPADSGWLGYLSRVALSLLCLQISWIVGFKGVARVGEIISGTYRATNPDEIGNPQGRG